MTITRKITWILLFTFMATALLMPGVTTANAVGSSINIESGVLYSDAGLLLPLLLSLLQKWLGPLLPTTTPSSPSTPVPPLPDSGSGSVNALQGKRIVIDPGHGGSNPGTVHGSFHEADTNLAIAKRLQAQLTSKGATVYMTRTTDQTVAPEGSTLGAELAARVDFAAAKQADVFVSIHGNSNDNTSIAGAMSFYPAGKSSALAAALQKGLIEQTGAQDKGIADATFYVLRANPLPAALIETGFLSNPDEAARLATPEYQEKIAAGLCIGLNRYFAQTR